MRIVVDYRPALRARTGVGNYVFHLVEALLDRDSLVRSAPGTDAEADEITIFASSWKDRPVAAELAALRRARWVDRRVPVHLLNLAWHRLGWPPVEQVTRAGYDVAYSPSPLLLPSRNAAGVVTIHDLDFLEHPERSVREIRRDYPKLVREHAHKADHVIVVSHYTARQVQAELGLSADSMTVCYPGAPDWPAATPDRCREHILFVGTLDPRKNVGTLLDAYEMFLSRRKDALPLVLVGGAVPDAAGWLERIRQPPLAGRVRYAGYVADGERIALFEKAALFVLPSFDEGFGMPVLEAMAAGVPVVVSNRGALPEVVGDAGTIIEDPEDADALSMAIERVLDDEMLAAAQSARGVQRARQFRWSATAMAARRAFERAIEHREHRIR